MKKFIAFIFALQVIQAALLFHLFAVIETKNAYKIEKQLENKQDLKEEVRRALIDLLQEVERKIEEELKNELEKIEEIEQCLPSGKWVCRVET